MLQAPASWAGSSRFLRLHWGGGGEWLGSLEDAAAIAYMDGLQVRTPWCRVVHGGAVARDERKARGVTRVRASQAGSLDLGREA